MASANGTVISEGAFVRGRITGGGDLAIAGRVEGEVEVSGDLVVEAGGLVAANLSARRLVVRGAVKGDLSAADAVELDAGARVVGDVRAPRIRIAPGALVRGFVTTGPAQAGARAQKPAARAAAPVAPKAAAAPPPPPPPKREAPKPVAKSNGGNKMPRGATLAGARPGPPPPVVPALKKGAKAVQKKR